MRLNMYQSTIVISASNVKDIVFQKKSSDNPICRKKEYFNVILNYMPQLNVLFVTDRV